MHTIWIEVDLNLADRGCSRLTWLPFNAITIVFHGYGVHSVFLARLWWLKAFIHQIQHGTTHDRTRHDRKLKLFNLDLSCRWTSCRVVVVLYTVHIVYAIYLVSIFLSCRHLVSRSKGLYTQYDYLLVIMDTHFTVFNVIIKLHRHIIYMFRTTCMVHIQCDLLFVVLKFLHISLHVMTIQCWYMEQICECVTEKSQYEVWLRRSSVGDCTILHNMYYLSIAVFGSD